MVSDPNNPNSVAYNSRNKRMQMFISALQGAGISDAIILDVGGTYRYWEKYAEMLPPGLIKRIDIVNLPEQVKDLHGQDKWYKATISWLKSDCRRQILLRTAIRCRAFNISD